MKQPLILWGSVGLLVLGLSGCVKKTGRMDETVREVEQVRQIDPESVVAPRATVAPEDLGEVLVVDGVDEEGKVTGSTLTVAQKTEGDMIVFTMQGSLPTPEGATFYEVYLMNPETSEELYAGRLEAEQGVYYLQASFDATIIAPFTQVWVTRETVDDERPEKAVLVSPIEK